MQEREKKKEKISWFADVACCRKEGEERNVLPPSKLVIRTSQNGKKSVRRKKIAAPGKTFISVLHGNGERRKRVLLSKDQCGRKRVRARYRGGRRKNRREKRRRKKSVLYPSVVLFDSSTNK